MREIPRIYADLERDLGVQQVHSFLRMGQWIGGDRDGNPNVGADTLVQALRRQSEVALRHYLTEVHLLGGDVVAVGAPGGRIAQMQALAAELARHQRDRLDEPYRRALTGIYARLAATLQAPAAARLRATPRRYKTPTPTPEGSAQLRTIDASWQAHHGAALATERLHPLFRAVEVFGFDLATVICAKAPTSTSGARGGGASAGRGRTSHPRLRHAGRGREMRCAHVRLFARRTPLCA